MVRNLIRIYIFKLVHKRYSCVYRMGNLYPFFLSIAVRFLYSGRV